MKTLAARKSSTLHNAASPRRTSRYSHLGASAGLRPLGFDALIREVRAGLSFKSIERLSAASGISVPAIAALIEVPERTLARRKSVGRFTPQESERLLRVSGVFEKAMDLFDGNVSEALAWLSRPKRGLGFMTPLDCLRTELGARRVEDLIGSLLHGVFV
jgi:putative toxin-antitoxin system antitoxin component (TIGR02293 family)